MRKEEYINKILLGDNITILNNLPKKSVDVIFADPPSNIEIENNNSNEINQIKNYDAFTIEWLKGCRRVLKEDATIWVIGNYNNIHRIGAIMQDLGFCPLNDIVWIKSNHILNFKTAKFNDTHEILIWASKSKTSKYTFHYEAIKCFNDDLQMRTDWHIPIRGGKNPAQKPAELLLRIILATSNVGDIVLDPFMGSGTTGAVAKRLNRNFIGIEREELYVKNAIKRIEKIKPLDMKFLNYDVEIKSPRIAFGNLIEKGLIKIGELLFSKDKKYKAIVNANGSLIINNFIGSIHKTSANILENESNNGWRYWHVERNGKLVCIDHIRNEYIRTYLSCYKYEYNQDDIFYVSESVIEYNAEADDFFLEEIIYKHKS